MLAGVLALALVTPPFLARERFADDVALLRPEARDVPAALLVLGGVAALTRMDAHPSAQVATHAPGVLSRFEPLGRYAVGNGLGLASLGVGLARHDGRWASAGVAFLEANLLSSLLVSGLQSLAGRARPGTPHAGEFGRGGSSFPSAHAAHAFAAAGVAYASLPEFGGRWVFPAVASLVALSRVADRKHFLADVGFSAGAGWWIGTRLGASGRRHGRWEVAVAPARLAVRWVGP